jgi:hypothetical protein
VTSSSSSQTASGAKRKAEDAKGGAARKGAGKGGFVKKR